MSSLDKIEKPADRVKQGEHETASTNMSREANSKDQLSKLVTPGGVCIRDPQGYIECGPIVGYPRPETANPPEGIAKPESPETPGPYKRPDAPKEYPMIGNPLEGPLLEKEFQKRFPNNMDQNNYIFKEKPKFDPK